MKSNANNMQTAQEHLKNAPSPYLSKLRSKYTKKTGLVQNSRIHDELCEEVLNPERLKSWLSKREEWEAQALCLIYASYGRGLHFLELERNINAEQTRLKAFLGEAASELFIWSAKCQSSRVYYGFAEFEEHFISLMLKSGAAPDSSAIWFSNGKKAELHLLSMLAKIQLGKMLIKKDCSLGRLSQKHMAEIFASLSSFDKAMEADCIRLLLSFLISEKWVAKNADSGELMLQPPAFSFLHKNGFRLFAELVFWWEKERFQGKGTLLKILKCFESPVTAYTAARLFWPHDACSRLAKNESAIAWDGLPLPLRELWILGILKMQKKKHATAFALSDLGESLFLAKQPKDGSIAEPIIASSSNFEWLLSQSCGPLKVFQMLCFAALKNEEEPLRFSLSKESFMAGLRSNPPGEYVSDFLSWNKAVPNVASALKEWQRIYNDSKIETLRVLRINNSEKYSELSLHKPFRDCIEESIPNWGFVIKPECEKKIRDILAHFSLEPASAASSLKTEEVAYMMETEGFKLPCPVPSSHAIYE